MPRGVRSGAKRGEFRPTHQITLVGGKPSDRRTFEVALGNLGSALTREQWDRGLGPAEATWWFTDGRWTWGDLQTPMPEGYRSASVHKLGMGPTPRAGETAGNIVFRATQTERDAIDADARLRGETRSDWIRAAIKDRLASSELASRSFAKKK